MRERFPDCKGGCVTPRYQCVCLCTIWALHFVRLEAGEPWGCLTYEHVFPFRPIWERGRPHRRRGLTQLMAKAFLFIFFYFYSYPSVSLPIMQRFFFFSFCRMHFILTQPTIPGNFRSCELNWKPDAQAAREIRVCHYKEENQNKT